MKTILALLLALLISSDALAIGRWRSSYSYGYPTNIRYNSPPRLLQPTPPVHPFAAQGVIVYPTANEFVDVSNKMRQEVGKQPLLPDMRLTRTAQSYANICRDKGFIDHYHNGTTVGQRVQQFGFQFVLCEEILTGGPQMLDRDPFANWKASPKHYEAVLGNATHCGFAVAYDAKGYGYWVGIYATPAKISTGN
jgi:uncharacterized protein YkwD